MQLLRLVEYVPPNLLLPSNAKQWTVTQSECNGDLSENSNLPNRRGAGPVEESDSEFSPG